MERIAVYPGSFDPVTTGHMDLIRRAAVLFDKVYVCVLHSPVKKGCFPVERRVELLRAACAGLPNVTVDADTGLTVDYARRVGACALLRGLRSEKDYQAEEELAQLNRRLAPELETVFLLSAPEHRCVSSSAVRELAGYQGDLTGFVPEEIKEAVLERFKD